MTAGVVIIIIIIIVARLIGGTRAVELLVSNEGVQIVEADVTGVMSAVQTFVGESSRSCFTLLVRWWQHQRRRRDISYFRFAIHLNLSRDLLWCRGGCRFRCRFVVEHACYIILLLG